jgi:hypothetical protein
MKLFKSILFTLLTLSLFTNVSLAVNKCPGAPATLRWSSANCSTDFLRNSTINGCKFDEAQANTSGSKDIVAGNTPGSFCTVTLSCKGNQGTTASSQAELIVADGPQCCSVGTALAEGRNVWSGVKSKCIAYPKPILTATTTPASTTPSVKWSCEEPATSYTITRNAPWASAPAWANGTTTSTTTGLEGAAVDTDTVAKDMETSYEYTLTCRGNNGVNDNVILGVSTTTLVVPAKVNVTNVSGAEILVGADAKITWDSTGDSCDIYDKSIPTPIKINSSPISGTLATGQVKTATNTVNSNFSFTISPKAPMSRTELNTSHIGAGALGYTIICKDSTRAIRLTDTKDAIEPVIFSV